MKKLIALVVGIVLIFGNICFADVAFNPDEYTDEELGEIYSIISEKINGCVKVPAGMFVVGKDLPAGTYTVLSNDEVPDNEGDDFSHVAVFKNMEEYSENPDDFFGDDSLAVMACNTLWNGMSMELTDDMVIVVKMGMAGIRKANSGIFDSFWE